MTLMQWEATLQWLSEAEDEQQHHLEDCLGVTLWSGYQTHAQEEAFAHIVYQALNKVET